MSVTDAHKSDINVNIITGLKINPIGKFTKKSTLRHFELNSKGVAILH